MDPLPGFDYWYGHRGHGSYFDNTFNENGERLKTETGFPGGRYHDQSSQLEALFQPGSR